MNPAINMVNRRAGAILPLLIAVLAIILAFSGSASAEWLIDRAKLHVSPHGEMGCVDCHQEIADQETHPDPAKVAKSRWELFKPESCEACHDEVFETLEEGVHGSRRNLDPKKLTNCTLCHDPHYLAHRGEDKPKFKPGVAKAAQCGTCHEARKELPSPSEDDKACLECHLKPAAEADDRVARINGLCFSCHQAGAEKAAPGATLIDKDAFEETIHGELDCLVCHPGAAKYKHAEQQPADCRSCHARHDEKVAHDPHATVSCQACHARDVTPIRNELTRMVGVEPIKLEGKPSKVHELAPVASEDECRRCHTAGNKVGAASMVLPPKSIICMPCHTSTFSVGDTTTIVSLLIFLFGLISAGAVWFSGAMAGASSTWAKLAGALGGMLRAIFSPRIFQILKALFVDSLFQPELFRKSDGRWVIHSLIFWPFVIRFIYGMIALVSTVWGSETSLGWGMIDKNNGLTALLFDLTGLMVIVGVVAAIFRGISARAAGRPEGLPGQDKVALGLIGGIIVVGFVLEGMRIAMTGGPEGSSYAFVGFGLAQVFKGAEGLTGLYGYIWYLHAILTGALVAYLPFSRMFHIITGPLVLAVKAGSVSHHHNSAENESPER